MRDSAGHAASAAIRRLVTGGGYRPGDRLPPERELAEALGLSRPTVREATRRLIESGLLVARHGSGTYLADVDLDAVFAVRLRLEPYAASLAAEHRAPQLNARLAGLTKELAGQINDVEAFVDADMDIHRTIAEASGNRILFDVLDRLTDLTALSRGVTSPAEEARKATVRDLRSLVRAVRAGDADAAAAAMEAHLEAVRGAAARATRPDRRLGHVAGGVAA